MLQGKRNTARDDEEYGRIRFRQHYRRIHTPFLGNSPVGSALTSTVCPAARNPAVPPFRACLGLDMIAKLVPIISLSGNISKLSEYSVS
jgi:hypothetical protein